MAFSGIPSLAKLSSRDDVLEQVADLYCEINVLHPFREGNGRAQRLFFEELMFSLGYDVTWPAFSQDYWIEANVAGVNLDLEPLKSIFDQVFRKV